METKFKVIEPKGKEYKPVEVVVEIEEPSTRKVSLSALDSAIDMLKNGIVRYKKMIEVDEKGIKNLQAERYRVRLEIEKAMNIEIKD